MFGDPHIVTFDGLHFDCQASGEFTTLTSLENPSFKIQERFVAVESSNTNTCSQASVSTGVAFVDANKPVLQISIPANGDDSMNTVNGCPVDFYVNGSAHQLENSLWGSDASVSMAGANKIKIQHDDTLLALDVVVSKSASFGCHIMVQVSIPMTFHSGETLLGLLGTPNGKKYV